MDVLSQWEGSLESLLQDKGKTTCQTSRVHPSASLRYCDRLMMHLNLLLIQPGSSFLNSF